MRRDELRPDGGRRALVPVGDVKRWSDRERKALVRYIREQQATGRLTVVSELARELGVSPSAIYGWMRWHREGDGSEGSAGRQRTITASVPRGQDSGFVEVAVVASEPVVAVSRPTVVSPSGYRVEGLDLAGVVGILKALS